MCTKLTLGGFFFPRERQLKEKQVTNSEHGEYWVRENTGSISQGEFWEFSKNLTNYIEDDINRSSWKAQGDWKKIKDKPS